MRRSSGSSSFSPARERPPPTITVDGFRIGDRGRDATGQSLEQLVENAPRRHVAAVRRREDDLGVDCVRVSAGELEQRRALAGCGRATAEAGERGPACGVLERPEPVSLRVVVEDREVADLAGCATGSAVHVAADQDTAADADADLDVESIVDPLRGATPALGQDGEMHLVVDEHRAGELRLQSAREPDSLPTAELGRERDPARYRVDDAWRADADRLQAAPVDPGTGQDFVGRGTDEIEESVGGLPIARARPASDGRRSPRP